MTLMQFVLLWLALLSVIGFLAMGLDKRAARRGARRTPEKRLFLFALLGGAAGSLAGMYVFHHKTRHWYFVVGFWALTLLQVGAVVYVFFILGL